MRDDEFCNLPSFFKLILSPRLDTQKLEMPRKFMENYGEELSDEVQLEVPTGTVWKVDLVREESRTWLQNGWPEFVNFYSISHGHFLVFRYKTNSNFHVIIFDMTASEIQYPYDAQPMPCNRTRAAVERKRGSSATKPISLIASNQDKRMKAVREATPKRVFGRKCVLTGDEAKRVEAHRCKQPSFVVKTQPSYVGSKFNVNLPTEFVKKYLNGKLGMFALENESDRTWSVMCTESKKGKSKVVTFNQGWKNFALDNNLQVGDICIFELIKDENKFMVKILALVAKEIPQIYPQNTLLL